MMRLALDPVDIPAVQAWLEDWAARGWYVESYGRNLVSFARGERREHIRYRLQPTGREGGEPDQDTREVYREMGWTYVCSTVGSRNLGGVRTEFHIWRCEDPAAPELDTDQTLREEAYGNLLRRGWRIIWMGVPLAAAVLALLAGYGGSRRLLRVSLCFFTAAAAFGGGIFALELLGGRGLTLHNGVFYSAMDLRVILLSAAGCYVLITLVFHRAGRHSAAAAELAPVLLTLEGRKAALTALVDTGNTLTDPVDGRPVMVAEGERLSRLFPQGLAPDAQALRDPAQTMQRLAEHGWRRCRLLPYQAVGVECGLLLCVRVDGARVGGQDYGKLLVALSPNRLSDGGGYSALIGT